MDGDNNTSKKSSAAKQAVERPKNPVSNSDIKKRLEEARQEKNRNDKCAVM